MLLKWSMFNTLVVFTFREWNEIYTLFGGHWGVIFMIFIPYFIPFLTI